MDTREEFYPFGLNLPHVTEPAALLEIKEAVDGKEFTHQKVQVVVFLRGRKEAVLFLWRKDT